MSDERKFLHGLATPVGTLFIMVDNIMEDGKTRTPDELDQLTSVFNCLSQLKTLIQDRQKLLSERGET